MKKQLQKIVKELKTFLSAAQEDDFTPQRRVRKTACEPKRRKSAAKKQTAEVMPAINGYGAKPAEAKPSPAPKEEPQIPAASALQPSDKTALLNDIAQKILTCSRCELGATRIKAVPGEGNPNAKLMFIGEGPGYDEDRQGRPFVGRAGQLLDKIIIAMGFTREEVFIGNMVKCHPMIDPSDPQKHGNDRAPKPEEIAFCRRYIEQQIKIISPDYIVALGGVAAKSLIRDTASLSSLRGQIFDLELTTVELDKPVKIIATYHPAALLRNPNWKKDAWADLKMLLKAMGRSPAAQ